MALENATRMVFKRVQASSQVAPARGSILGLAARQSARE
jgi:hypothetical protein